MLAIDPHSNFDAVALSLRPLPCGCKHCDVNNPLEGILHEHFVCVSKNRVSCNYNCAGISVHTWLDVVSKSEAQEFMDDKSILPSIRETFKYKCVHVRIRGRSGINKDDVRIRKKTLRVNV